MSEGELKKFIDALERTSLNHLNAEAIRGKLDEVAKEIDIRAIKDATNWIHYLWHQTSELEPGTVSFTLKGKYCEFDYEKLVITLKALEKWFGEPAGSDENAEG